MVPEAMEDLIPFPACLQTNLVSVLYGTKYAAQAMKASNTHGCESRVA